MTSSKTMIQSPLGTIATPHRIAGTACPDWLIGAAYANVSAEDYKAHLWSRMKRDLNLMDVLGQYCGKNVVVEGGTRGQVRALLAAIDYSWEVRYDSLG